MNFWWVNHKQTFRQEFFGKYIWSPKRKRSGHVNHFYETMREVSPGDVVFSFAFGAIQGFGMAKTHCYTSPRPDEFGHIGHSWNEVGWRVDVDFTRIPELVRPSQHMQAILPTLPERYSPINQKGHGQQQVYLAQIPRSMALMIASLASPELVGLIQGIQLAETPMENAPVLPGVIEWEEQESQRISTDREIPETQKEALIKARRGQGLFRQRVTRIERMCRVTRVTNPEHLIAGHIKPWRESDNQERLLGANGLLLTPSIDHLFDRGFISFENNGELLVSPVAHKESLEKMGVPTEQLLNVGGFAEGQKGFLEYHRGNIFLQSESAIGRRR
jgi:putative restriction endonuclease